MSVTLPFYSKKLEKRNQTKNLLIELDFMDKFNVVEKKLNSVNRKMNTLFTNQLVDNLKFYKEVLLLDKKIPTELHEDSDLKIIYYKQIFKVHIEFFDKFLNLLNSKHYKAFMTNLELVTLLVENFRKLNTDIKNNLTVDKFKVDSQIFELTKELLETQKLNLNSIYKKAKVTIPDRLQNEMHKYIALSDDLMGKLEFSKNLFDFTNSLNDTLNHKKPEMTPELKIEMETQMAIWKQFKLDAKQQTDMLHEMVISQLARTKEYSNALQLHQERMEMEISNYNYVLSDLNNYKYNLNEYSEVLRAFEVDLSNYSAVKVVYVLTLYNLFMKVENQSQKLRNIYKTLYLTENKNDVCDVQMENSFLILDEKLVDFKSIIREQITTTNSETLTTYDYRSKINMMLMFTTMVDLLQLNPIDLENLSEIKPNLSSNINYISELFSKYYDLILNNNINNNAKFKQKEILSLSLYEELSNLLESNNDLSSYIINTVFYDAFSKLNDVSDYLYHFNIQIKKTIYNFNKLFTNLILLELNVLKVTYLDEGISSSKFNVSDTVNTFKKLNNQVLFIKNNLSNTNGSVFYSFDKLLTLLLTDEATQYKINNIAIDKILDNFNHFNN